MSGDTVLMGVPDVSLQSLRSLSPPTESNLAVVSSITQPVEVMLPLPEILTEGYLEIRAVETQEVITIIEVLSPKNKQVGIGRLQYETKRLKILGSATHFVEIDLLRQGNSMAMLGNFQQSHYRIVVSHSETRPKAHLYSFNLVDRIPEFTVPLRATEPEPALNLKSLLDEIYDQGSYDLRIDYSRPPIPALSESDMTVNGEAAVIVQDAHSFQQILERLESVEKELRAMKLDALQKDVTAGIEQLELGNYEEYDEDTLPELFGNIKAKGRQRLADCETV